MSAKIKKGDTVIIIAGKDKGRTGQVKSLLPGANKVIVFGVNLVKKHVKANPDRGIQGGIIEREQPIHVSNVALFDQSGKKPSRVGFKYLENNKKVRYLKTSKEIVL
jgi:large subunit ribosomal protein L24